MAENKPLSAYTFQNQAQSETFVRLPDGTFAQRVSSGDVDRDQLTLELLMTISDQLTTLNLEAKRQTAHLQAITEQHIGLADLDIVAGD